jgi:hypothetical protein
VTINRATNFGLPGWRFVLVGLTRASSGWQEFESAMNLINFPVDGWHNSIGGN